MLKVLKKITAVAAAAAMLAGTAGVMPEEVFDKRNKSIG